MTTITTLVPAAVAAPRGARWAAQLFGALLRALQRARTDRAVQVEQADRVSEAAATRRYAMRFLTENPRFAADLLAAADRHERGG